MLNSECLFKAKIFQMILMKENVEAIKVLSHHFDVAISHLKVGMSKKYSKKLASDTC